MRDREAWPCLCGVGSRAFCGHSMPAAIRAFPSSVRDTLGGKRVHRPKGLNTRVGGRMPMEPQEANRMEAMDANRSKQTSG
jgi:hypothetical protein